MCIVIQPYDRSHMVEYAGEGFYAIVLFRRTGVVLGLKNQLNLIFRMSGRGGGLEQPAISKRRRLLYQPLHETCCRLELRAMLFIIYCPMMARAAR